MGKGKIFDLVFLVFVFLLVFSSFVVAREDEIFTLRSPEFKDSDFFLLGEDIVFGVYVEDVNDVTFYTKCLDNTDNRFLINTNFTTRRMTDNLFLTQFRNDEAQCQELEIGSKFIKNDEIVTLSKLIRIVYYSPIPESLVLSQLESGSWNDHPLSTAYAIYALSRYDESFDREIDLGMRWLKENRGEDDKCWPKEECDIDTTVKVHSLLWLSEYDDKYRIIHNSRLWIIDRQNWLEEGTEWEFVLNASHNFTECIYNNSFDKQNETILTAIILNETNRFGNKKFEAMQGHFYDILCTQNVSLELYDRTNNRLAYNGTMDNLSYQIPNKCWSDYEKWNLCDYETTGFALFSDVPVQRRTPANDWMTSNLKSSSFGSWLSKKNSTLREDVIDTALYLFNNPNNKDIIDWLFYYQNNEGSWGNIDDTYEDKLEATVYAILALQKSGFTDEDESLYDAKKWIYSSVPYGDWDTIKKTSLAHVALSTYSKKFLNIKPRIIEIGDSPVNVELYNPTSFYFGDLSFSFTENLNNYIDYDVVETINSDTYKTINIKAKEGIKVGDYYGTMVVKNGNNILNEIPVMVGKKPILRFSYTNSSVIFGPRSSLKLTAEVDDAEYECFVKWNDPQISSDEKFILTKQNNVVDLKYSLDQPYPENKLYVGEISCDVNNKKVYSTISTYIKQYKTQPFEVSENLISIDNIGQDYSFNVTNLIDESLKINVKFNRDEVFFMFDIEDFTLQGGETQTITIINLVGDDVNVSSSNIIIVNSIEGVEKRITFSSEIMMEEKKSFNFFIIIYVLIGFIVLFGILLNFFIIFRKSIIDSLPEKQKKVAQKLEQLVIGLLNKILPENMKLVLSSEQKSPEEIEKLAKNAVQNNEDDSGVDYHVADMVDIMRSLGKTDSIIRKELEQEGFNLKQIDEGLLQADKIIEEKQAKEKKKKQTEAGGHVGQ